MKLHGIVVITRIPSIIFSCLRIKGFLFLKEVFFCTINSSKKSDFHILTKYEFKKFPYNSDPGRVTTNAPCIDLTKLPLLILILEEEARQEASLVGRWK